MSEKQAKSKQNCPREEIGMYLDGELSPPDESALEEHFALCQICLGELNNQKEMLLALGFAFDKEDDLELPKDFTKIIIANAESGVTGLRSKKERSNALFLCCGLFLIIAFGLGTDSERALSMVGGFGRNLTSLAAFLWHLLSDISVGAVVILRCLSQQFIYSPLFLTVLSGSLLVLTIIFLIRLKGRLRGL